MTARFFVDTNVAVYALGRHGDKRDRALSLLYADPVISTQVVNETISVLTGKQRFTYDEACEIAEALLKLGETLPLGPDLVRDAMAIGRRHAFSHWDALIVAAALASGCDILYSEDMQHGQEIDGRLTIVDPFRG